MAGNFFRNSTSTIGTTTPPNTEIWSMIGANCKIIDIFWRLEDAGVPADLDPLDLDPPPLSKSASGYGSPGPNPPADMDPPVQIR